MVCHEKWTNIHINDCTVVIFAEYDTGLSKPMLESSLTFLFFYFGLKWEKLSKNKNPPMTPVKKTRSLKLNFWVWGSSYLLGRYLMQGSTPSRPRVQSLPVNWVHWSIWVKDQSILHRLHGWQDSYNPSWFWTCIGNRQSEQWCVPKVPSHALRKKVSQ